MRRSLYLLETFGEILSRNSTGEIPVPAGWLILKNKLPSELSKFQTYLQDNHSQIQNKQDLLKYVSLYNQNSKEHFVKNKLLTQAYIKAGKNPRLHIATTQNEKNKLMMILHRNWPLLKYIAFQSGIDFYEKLKEDFADDTWGFSDELDEEINEKKFEHVMDSSPKTTEHIENRILQNTESIKDKIIQTQNVKEDNKISLNDKPHNDDFSSFLKKLNRIHDTPVYHVLPEMTLFDPEPIKQPTKLNELDMIDFQLFLQNAKVETDLKDDSLFKAKKNYEWSNNILFKQPTNLEFRNFFTPILVPKTLYQINDKLFQKINKAQCNMGVVDPQKVKILKVYGDGGKSSVLNNVKNEFWNGEVFDYYKIIKNLKNPKEFQQQEKMISKLLTVGWIPVTSDERSMVFIKSEKQHQKVVKYTITSMATITIISGLWWLCI